MRPSSQSAKLSAENSGNHAFTVDYMSEGLQAHGFGKTEHGRTFSFRVTKSTLEVTIYHEAAAADIPDSSEVVGRARVSVDDIDLTDERSVIGAIRDALDAADDL